MKHINTDVLITLPENIGVSLKKDALESMRSKALQIFKNQLAKKGGVNTGNLSNAAEAKTFKVDKTTFGLQLVVKGKSGWNSPQDYVEALDEGLVGGKWYNIAAIKKWLLSKRGSLARRTVGRKNTKLTAKQRSSEISRQAFLVARKLFRDGTVGKDFIEPSIDDINSMINKELKKWVRRIRMK